MERVLFVSDDKNYEEECYAVTLWKYHEITILHKGNTFGEIALREDGNCKRTATIIAMEDCYFGTLSKKMYQSCISEVIEKIRKQNVIFIISCYIFKGVDLYMFEKHYYNYFKSYTLYKGQKLFTQHMKKGSLYFIKEGEIEIIMNTNYFNLNTIIKKLGGKVNNKEEMGLLFSNKRICEYYNNKRKLNIFVVKNGNVIGMEDYLSSDGCFFNEGICVSKVCEVLEIENDFFDKIVKENSFIQKNYEEYEKKRKMIMLRRLNKIKEVYYYKIVDFLICDKNTSFNNKSSLNFSNNVKEMKRSFNSFNVYSNGSNESIKIINSNIIKERGDNKESYYF